MYHNNERKSTSTTSLKSRICMVTSLLIIAGAVALYVTLTKAHAGNAYLYSMPFIWVVIIISLVAGFVVFLFLNLLLSKINSKNAVDNEVVEEETTEETESETYELNTDVDNNLLEEYPELFGNEKTEDAYSPVDVASMIKTEEAELTEQPETEDNTDEAWNTFVGHKEEIKTTTEILYEEIDDEIPEDYRPAETEDAPVSVNSKKKIYLSKAFIVIVILIALAAAFISSILMSFSYISEDNEKITICSIVNSKTYAWAEIAEVEVSSGWSKDLTIKIVTVEGTKIDITPSTLFQSDDFNLEYSSKTEWASAIVEKMCDNGAVKTIVDRDAIVAVYGTEDNIPEYIKSIID